MACLCHTSRLIYSVTEHVISEAKPKVHGDQSTSTNSPGRNCGRGDHVQQAGVHVKHFAPESSGEASAV
jgi:hypothetical protein